MSSLCSQALIIWHSLRPKPGLDVRLTARGLQARKPVLYIGGGCLGSSEEVQELVRRTGIPVAQTLMGLGAFPESHPLALQVMPGSRMCD